MAKQYDTSVEMLEQVPMELWPIGECYEYQSNLNEWNKRHNNPFYVFLYLIGYQDKLGNGLPYDYAPSDNLPFLELQLLSKALMTYSLMPNAVISWIEQLLELVDDEQLADTGVL
jgi:hypothetical protein